MNTSIKFTCAANLQLDNSIMQHILVMYKTEDMKIDLIILKFYICITKLFRK